MINAICESDQQTECQNQEVRAQVVDDLETPWRVDYGKLQSHLGDEQFNLLMNNFRYCERCHPFFNGSYYDSICPASVADADVTATTLPDAHIDNFANLWHEFRDDVMS